MICLRCSEDKPTEAFAVHGTRKSGRHSYCKACMSAYHKARRQDPVVRAANTARQAALVAKDPEKHSAYMRRYNHRPEVKAKRRAATARWSKENPERVKALRSAHYQRNKVAFAEARDARRAHKKMATPLWADRKAMAAIYRSARRMNKEGMDVAVDHIVPLLHALVCGLHVETNLSIVPAFDNRAKSNRHWPDMP